jgi:hypothetical protein
MRRGEARVERVELREVAAADRVDDDVGQVVQDVEAQLVEVRRDGVRARVPKARADDDGPEDRLDRRRSRVLEVPDGVPRRVPEPPAERRVLAEPLQAVAADGVVEEVARVVRIGEAISFQLLVLALLLPRLAWRRRRLVRPLLLPRWRRRRRRDGHDEQVEKRPHVYAGDARRRWPPAGAVH